MSIRKGIRAGVAKLAALGGVKRRGIGALTSYGGTVEGEGYVHHKSGPRKGETTHFKIKGRPAA